MICSRCHKEISDQALFCTECGQRVTSGTETLTPASLTPASLTRPALTPSSESPVLAPSTFAPTPAVSGTQVPNPEHVAPTAQPQAQDFVPASYDVGNPGTPYPVQGAVPSATQAAPVFVPVSYDAGYTGTAYIPQPVEESTYYHIDATECYDFEGIRGMSIAMIIISLLSVVGILMPLPIAIVSLVTSCNAVGYRDVFKRKQAFNKCRTLLIVSVCLIAFYALLAIGTISILAMMGKVLPSID